MILSLIFLVFFSKLCEEKMNQELISLKEELERKIKTLEWDKGLRQINFAQTNLLDSYKKQLEDINKKLGDK